MSVFKSITLSLAAGGLLAACSVENCGDPSQDRLGTALNCTVNAAGYQAQTDALSAELTQKQTIASQLREDNARINRQLASLNAEGRQAANRLINVNAQIASLDDSLNVRLRNQQISQAEFNIAQTEIGQLERRRRAVTPGDPAQVARLAELESEVADLRSLF